MIAIPTLPSTLWRYLAKSYAVNLGFMAAILLGTIFMFDLVELLRRAAKHDDLSFMTVLRMGLLKLPEMAMLVAPFIILFSALFTFWQLSKRQELVVLRSAGISVWQFLSPIIAVATVTGIFMVAIVNPVSALLYSRYTVLESTYLDRHQETVAIFDEGLWLRQDSIDGYAILHADRIEMPDWRLHSVMVLFFDHGDNFTRRLDAEASLLRPGKWQMKTVTLSKPGTAAVQQKDLEIETRLTPSEIEDSFSSPQTMGFWSLPSYISTLDATGFDSTRLRIHFQTLLAQPLLFAAMILLAAAVAIRPQRQGHTFLFISTGVVVGFIVFFMSNFLQALGASHQIPVFLSAWSTAMICLLLGVATLLTFEDG